MAVLVRIRQVLLLLLAALMGYALGIGPFADWTADVGNAIAIAWASQRINRGATGTVPMLLGGYLLGQGSYWLLRQTIARLGSHRSRRVEAVAAWDPAVQLATRFGLHQYLERCAVWAAEDPTTRLQSLALFKLRGLGATNEAKGTLVVTELLQRVGAELRSASLPDTTSGLTRWITHHFPRPILLKSTAFPAVRYPARWSGATFALAFRELEAVQVVSITRDLATWIRKELAALDGDLEHSVSACVAIATAGVAGRGLSVAAATAIAHDSGADVTVLLDPVDVRANAIEQMNGVSVVRVTMPRNMGDHVLVGSSPDVRARFGGFLRTWGPGLGCLLGAIALLQLFGEKSPIARIFPWPDSLNEVQVLEQSGPRSVRLVRSRPTDQSTASWRLSEVTIIQGDPASGTYPQFQIHVSVTNTSQHNYFVSSFDLTAIDIGGRVISFDTSRVLRMNQGVAGRWLRPGESWSAWLLGLRGDAPIRAVRFEPDRFTRVEFDAAPPSAAAEPKNTSPLGRAE